MREPKNNGGGQRNYATDVRDQYVIVLRMHIKKKARQKGKRDISSRDELSVERKNVAVERNAR